MDPGATYTAVFPLTDNVPTAGLIVHVTAGLLPFDTVAVSVTDPPPFTFALVGDIDTVTAGCSVTAAVAALVGSAALEAETVTVCAAVTIAGAV
jgi:hypothetical protein